MRARQMESNTGKAWCEQATRKPSALRLMEGGPIYSEYGLSSLYVRDQENGKLTAGARDASTSCGSTAGLPPEATCGQKQHTTDSVFSLIMTVSFIF